MKTLETPAHKLNKDMLLNGFQINPAAPSEVLVCPRARSAYLLSLDTSQVLQDYTTNSQSKEEELLAACFSSDARHVYALSTMKNLYIFEKHTGKLVSMLLVPTTKAATEVGNMLVQRVQEGQVETMVIQNVNEIFKLDSKVV